MTGELNSSDKSNARITDLYAFAGVDGSKTQASAILPYHLESCSF